MPDRKGTISGSKAKDKNIFVSLLLKIVLNTDEMTDSINNEDYNQELVKPFRQRYFGDKTGEATKNVVEFTKELLDNNVWLQNDNQQNEYRKGQA